MKIQIIGYAGSGKSTLAKNLGEIFNIPVLHMDNTKFYGNWQVRTIDEQAKICQKFLDENDSWVIDGNYSQVCPQRFKESDMTIYMNFNRFKCFWSAYKRYKTNRTTIRESCPCLDKFDKSFRDWLLFGGRTRQRKQMHLENLNKTKGKRYVFKNRNQVNRFVQSLREKQAEKTL